MQRCQHSIVRSTVSIVQLVVSHYDPVLAAGWTQRTLGHVHECGQVIAFRLNAQNVHYALGELPGT